MHAWKPFAHLLLCEAQIVLLCIPLHEPHKPVKTEQSTQFSTQSQVREHKWGLVEAIGQPSPVPLEGAAHDVLGLDPIGLAVQELGLHVHSCQRALVVHQVQPRDVA